MFLKAVENGIIHVYFPAGTALGEKMIGSQPPSKFIIGFTSPKIGKGFIKGIPDRDMGTAVKYITRYINTGIKQAGSTLMSLKNAVYSSTIFSKTSWL